MKLELGVGEPDVAGTTSAQCHFMRALLKYSSLMNQRANTNRRLYRHWLLSESVIEAGGDAIEIPSLIPYTTINHKSGEGNLSRCSFQGLVGTIRV